MKLHKNLTLYVALWGALSYSGLEARETYNFNPGWLLSVGDAKEADKIAFDDSSWQKITLPHAFNEAMLSKSESPK